MLVFLFAASDRQLFGLDWWSAGAARAGPIVGGEYWRTITALGLHADLGHLAGNLFAGSVFGILLAQFLGPGLAWFAILLAAALGNAANALLQPAEHNAVGASTAVFAALGLLSALMWRRQATRWARGLRRWLPLAAGVTLLAYLGIGGERTDVGAHVAGFVAGVVFGAGLHVIGPRLPQGPAAQYTYGAAALALFCFAWLAASAPRDGGPASQESAREDRVQIGIFGLGRMGANIARRLHARRPRRRGLQPHRRRRRGARVGRRDRRQRTSPT